MKLPQKIDNINCRNDGGYFPTKNFDKILYYPEG
nr:hypothetical protein 495p1_00015 [Serratia proteamaculans]